MRKPLNEQRDKEDEEDPNQIKIDEIINEDAVVNKVKEISNIEQKNNFDTDNEKPWSEVIKEEKEEEKNKIANKKEIMLDLLNLKNHLSEEYAFVNHEEIDEMLALVNEVFSKMFNEMNVITKAFRKEEKFKEIIIDMERNLEKFNK